MNKEKTVQVSDTTMLNIVENACYTIILANNKLKQVARHQPIKSISSIDQN